MRIIKTLNSSNAIRHVESQEYYTTKGIGNYIVYTLLSDSVMRVRDGMEKVSNIIFEEVIRSTNQADIFENRDGLKFSIWPSENAKILQALLNGKAQMIDGYIRSHFSFRVRGYKIKMILSV